MQLSITQFQADIIKNSLKLYNIEMLSNAEEWKEYDNLFDKLADLSDTRGDAVFNNDPYEVPLQSDNKTKRTFI